MTATRHEIVHGGWHIDPIGQHRMPRSELGRDRERLGIPVDRDHLRTERRGDHDGAQADTAGTDDRDPLAFTHGRSSHECPVCRGEPAPKAGRRRDIDVIGQRNQIGVCGIERDVLSERAPVSKSGLPLIRTDLCITDRAPFAAAAPADEGHGDPIPNSPEGDTGAHLDHFASQLMPWHVGEGDVIVMPRPAVPVAATHPGCRDTYHHTACRGVGISNSENSGLGPGGFDHDGAHGTSLAP